jgi:septum formation protein
VIESLRRIILASTSPYRRTLLERLGIPFEQRRPPVDETAYRHLEPLAMARQLAQAKAESIHEDDALIIGSDQVVEVEGRVLGKPGSVERAVEQLLALAGRSHRLVTAVAVHDPATQSTEVDVDIHRLTMRQLSREMITKYVRADQPLDCAGSYKLERRGIALFERIEADPTTADDTAIVGLPLMKLCALLRKMGIEVLDP